MKNGIKIPYALSILAHNHPTAEVIGLNDIPIDEQPPLYIHYLFDLMVSIGMLLTVLALIYVVLYRRKASNPYRKPMLISIWLSGPLALLAIELGWIFAEVGRQPWILRGYMKTSEGATTAPYVDVLLLFFIALYAGLALVSTTVLRRMFKNNTVEQEIEQMNAMQEVDV